MRRNWPLVIGVAALLGIWVWLLHSQRPARTVPQRTPAETKALAEPGYAALSLRANPGIREAFVNGEGRWAAAAGGPSPVVFAFLGPTVQCLQQAPLEPPWPYGERNPITGGH